MCSFTREITVADGADALALMDFPSDGRCDEQIHLVDKFQSFSFVVNTRDKRLHDQECVFVKHTIPPRSGVYALYIMYIFLELI